VGRDGLLMMRHVLCESSGLSRVMTKTVSKMKSANWRGSAPRGQILSCSNFLRFSSLPDALLITRECPWAFYFRYSETLAPSGACLSA
jgi:hypothetical protein